MPDDEDKGTPSLEPPSFFGRKKRKVKPAPAPVERVGPRHTEPTAPPDADIRPELEPVPPPTADSPPTTFLEADEPTAPLPSAPPTPPTPPAPGPPPLFVDEAPATATAPEVPESPRPPRGPWLTGWAAVILTGLVVGGLIVGGTSGALRLCTAVKGTESCGNPGFLLLVAILVVTVLIGALLLRAARVPEPGSTSFLAVGLLSVVALLFLIDQLLEWWMVIVIPGVSVLTFLLSHWVTSSFVESSADDFEEATAPEVHDVR